MTIDHCGSDGNMLRPFRALDGVRVLFTWAFSPGWYIARFQRWGMVRELEEMLG